MRGNARLDQRVGARCRGTGMKLEPVIVAASLVIVGGQRAVGQPRLSNACFLGMCLVGSLAIGCRIEPVPLPADLPPIQPKPWRELTIPQRLDAIEKQLHPRLPPPEFLRPFSRRHAIDTSTDYQTFRSSLGCYRIDLSKGLGVRSEHVLLHLSDRRYGTGWAVNVQGLRSPRRARWASAQGGAYVVVGWSFSYCEFVIFSDAPTIAYSRCSTDVYHNQPWLPSSTSRVPCEGIDWHAS